jgi:hypothetical protein
MLSQKTLFGHRPVLSFRALSNLLIFFVVDSFYGASENQASLRFS